MTKIKCKYLCVVWQVVMEDYLPFTDKAQKNEQRAMSVYKASHGVFSNEYLNMVLALCNMSG